MKNIDISKIFENLEKNALSIARKMYNYNLDDDLHNFYLFTDRNDKIFSIWIDIRDPRPGGSPYACWEVRGQVFVDTDGNKTYRISFPLSNTINTEKYYPCTQTLSGMMREMEDWRLKFIRDGYITLCNVATEQIIDSLP